MHQSSLDFCGGSLVRVFTGPVIEIPNFTQEEPPPQRLVFMPKEINGETQYVLTRVEDGRTPYLAPEQIVEQYNNGPIDGRTLRAETPKRKMSPIEGITERDWNALLKAIRIVESNNNPDAVGDSVMLLEFIKSGRTTIQMPPWLEILGASIWIVTTLFMLKKLLSNI